MSRNDNANFGVGRIGGAGNVGLYSESSTAKYELGERLELHDGRVFRYCNFDAAVTVAQPTKFRMAPLPPEALVRAS